MSTYIYFSFFGKPKELKEVRDLYCYSPVVKKGKRENFFYDKENKTVKKKT